MKKLDIELLRYGNVLFGRVLHMDESLRGKGVLAEDGNLKIKSLTYLDLICGTLHVNGTSKEFDGLCFSGAYASESRAIEAAEKYKAMIDKINGEEIVKVTRLV